MVRPRTIKTRWLIAKRGSKVSTPTHVPKLNIAFLKINGINNPKKQSELLFLRKFHQWDIVALSDTRLTRPQDVDKLSAYFKATHSTWSFGSCRVGGTCLLFFKPVHVIHNYNDPKADFPAQTLCGREKPSHAWYSTPQQKLMKGNHFMPPHFKNILPKSPHQRSSF
jgi:hypothetical protein